MRSRFLLLSLLACAACEAPTEPEDDAAEVASGVGALTSDACMERAQAKAKAWAAQGMPSAQVELRTQTLVAGCLGVTDAATARFIATIRVDLFRASRQVIAGASTPEQFVLRARDRGQKARLARQTPGYAAAVARGDADGDLVPDDRDRCPGTPDLQPTDARGCPQRPEQAPRPIAPSAQALAPLLSRFNLVVDPRCDGAPSPSTPGPIKTGYWDGTSNVVLAGVTNQPAQCLVIYEIDGRFVNQNWAETGQLPPKYPRFVLRASEATPMAGLATGQLRFQVLPTDPRDAGNRKIFASFLGQYELVDWRVRAVNGNGQKSPWSDWQHLRHLAPI